METRHKNIEFIQRKHDFTAKELLEMGDSLAQKLTDKKELEDVISQWNKTKKAEKSIIEVKCDVLAMKINEGYEIREIEVYGKPDHSRGVMELFDVTTDELIDYRPLEAAERQLKIAEA